MVLNIMQKNQHRVYIATVTRICVGSQENIRESEVIFFYQHRGSPVEGNHLSFPVSNNWSQATAFDWNNWLSSYVVDFT